MRDIAALQIQMKVSGTPFNCVHFQHRRAFPLACDYAKDGFLGSSQDTCVLLQDCISDSGANSNGICDTPVEDSYITKFGTVSGL